MVAPITGMLRKGLVRELSAAIGLGTASGYAWWYGIHLHRVRTRDEFYNKIDSLRKTGQYE